MKTKQILLLFSLCMVLQLSAQDYSNSIWGKWMLNIEESSRLTNIEYFDVEILKTDRFANQLDSIISTIPKEKLAYPPIDVLSVRPKKTPNMEFMYGELKYSSSGEKGLEIVNLPIAFITTEYDTTIVLVKEDASIQKTYHVSKFHEKLILQNYECRFVYTKNDILSSKKFLFKNNDLGLFGMHGKVKSYAQIDSTTYWFGGLHHSTESEFGKNVLFSGKNFDIKGNLTSEFKKTGSSRVIRFDWEKKKQLYIGAIIDNEGVKTDSFRFMKRNEDVIEYYINPKYSSATDTFKLGIESNTIVKRQTRRNREQLYSYNENGLISFVDFVIIKKGIRYYYGKQEYLYLKVDSYGNWTERIVVDYQVEGKRIELIPEAVFQVRKIKYYN